MDELTPTSRKPTKAEMRRRIDVTESLLIDCATVHDIQRYFAEKEGLKIARRTIERYMQLADRRIEKAAEPIREREIRRAKVRFERCFARAISGNKKNIFAAIAAQKAINNLLGLSPRKDSEELTVQDLAKMVAVQRLEADRLRRGPQGLKNEITDLFERYLQTGEDRDDLIHELIMRLPPGDSDHQASTEQK